MEEIKKYDYEEWQSKYQGSDFSIPFAIDYSNNIDEALENCEEILNKVSLTIEYSSVKSDMQKYLLDSGVLYDYVGNIGTEIYYYIDTKLHDDFNKNATETISRINAEDIETKVIDNSEKIETNIEGVEIEEARSTLKFEDFMKENNDIGGLARNEFAKLFKVQYDNAIASGNIKEEVEYNKYIETLLKEGTFNHTIDTPVASFISDLLDVTIVKPIIEAIIGEDLITHDDLSGIERCFKAGMAVIDIVTLGQAGLFEGGLKAGGKNLLKTIGVEFLSNGAALTVNKVGEMVNLPAPIVLLLSLGAGYTVSRIGTKNIVKNAEGKVVYEADDAIKGVSKSDSLIDGLKVIDGKVNGKIPVDEFKKIRAESIKNVNSDTITLGKYKPTVNTDGTLDWTIPGNDSYTVMAGDTTYFSLGNDWDVIKSKYNITDKDMFDLFNVPALDDAIKLGKEIRFSHDPRAYGDCALADEWNYIMRKCGYTDLIKRGDFWYGVK